MLRSASSVLAGFCLWLVLWSGSSRLVALSLSEQELESKLATSTGLLLLYLGLSVTASVASGYLTSVIAGYEEIKHSLTLGTVLMAVGIYMQTRYSSSLPDWYHVSFVAFLIPGTLLGGRIRIESKT